MTYDLEFKVDAVKEWKSLNSTIKTELKDKLEKVISNKFINESFNKSLNTYMIESSKGVKLVYKIFYNTVIVFVIEKKSKF